MLTDNSLNLQKLIIQISLELIVPSLTYYIPETVSQLVPEYPSVQTHVNSSVVAPSTHVAGYLQGRLLHASKRLAQKILINISTNIY